MCRLGLKCLARGSSKDSPAWKCERGPSADPRQATVLSACAARRHASPRGGANTSWSVSDSQCCLCRDRGKRASRSALRRARQVGHGVEAERQRVQAHLLARAAVRDAGPVSGRKLADFPFRFTLGAMAVIQCGNQNARISVRRCLIAFRIAFGTRYGAACFGKDLNQLSPDYPRRDRGAVTTGMRIRHETDRLRRPLAGSTAGAGGAMRGPVSSRTRLRPHVGAHRNRSLR
ncbi:hypothetical protein CLV78_111102 [Aliiruegeria haliotis]|uniref:Uncharacterized protein n=1 Tax=Aliiruegeria haliotis TaxID=1280846 RepID=A0A2T0RIJ4_9RHOB|nr:hypothetical protein CLV78_111102 [Aliiruegeria haliotis]